MSMPRRGRLAALAALTVVSVGVGVLAVPASASTPGIHAAERAEAGSTTSAASPTLVSGRSSWGFKDSWVRYVTGSGGSGGSVNVAGGATADATGRVGYPVEHGSVDPAERSADVRFGGSVTYAVPSHGITAIRLANRGHRQRHGLPARERCVPGPVHRPARHHLRQRLRQRGVRPAGRRGRHLQRHAENHRALRPLRGPRRRLPYHRLLRDELQLARRERLHLDASRAQDVAQPLRFGVEVPIAAVTRHPASRTVRSAATGTFTAAATGADSVR